jgi:hypothetical protein
MHKQKFILPIIATIFLFSILPFALAGVYDAWAYNKTITITENNGTDLFNYTIFVNVPYNTNFSFANFSDLRFADATGDNALTYVFENKVDSSYAVAGIKIPFIPASSKLNITMFWGKSDAGSVEDFNNAFIFGEDFNTDRGLWVNNSNGYIVIENGIGNVTNNGDYALVFPNVSYQLISSGYIVEAKVKPSFFDARCGVASYVASLTDVSGGYGYNIERSGGTDYIEISKIAVAQLSEISLGNLERYFYTLNLTLTGEGQIGSISNDTALFSMTSSSDTDYTSGYYGLESAVNSAVSCEFDWFRIRQFVSEQPTYEFLEEEAPDTTSPVVTINFPTAVTYDYLVTEINFSASDETALGNCWYSLDGGATNTTTNCNELITSLTTADNSSYTWIVWANDTSGNEGSDSVAFSIDLPAIYIVYPTAITYTSQVTELNYLYKDSPEACWYSLDSGATNTTITCGENVTSITSIEGSNTWIVWANNSIGEIFEGSITFSVDLPEPPNPLESNGIYTTMRGAGAGIGIFMLFLGEALPILLIGLIMVAIVIAVAFAIVYVIKHGIKSSMNIGKGAGK